MSITEPRHQARRATIRDEFRRQIQGAASIRSAAPAWSEGLRDGARKLARDLVYYCEIAEDHNYSEWEGAALDPDFLGVNEWICQCENCSLRA